MDRVQRLGKNIKCIRVAYGESQEKLGEAIGVEKNTVSYYENGKREPNKDILRAIAVHYMISVEELLTGDFSKLEKITVNQNTLWEHIDEVLPVTCSEKAMTNSHFKRAYEIHRHFFDQLRQVKMDGIDEIDMCFEEYLEAYEDDNSKVESAANFIGLWYLFMVILKLTPTVLENRPAAMMQVASRDPKTRQVLENTDSNFAKEAKEIVEGIVDSEIEDLLAELLKTVKQSKDKYELADYYLALQFVWNLVDNDLSFEINRRIGVEMLNAFVTVENPYAAHFLWI